jgi:HD-GYP domain-containing protein (c-di-GMP phosphodiesterase class II)
MEHMIRACLIALRLGESLGLSSAERETVYYSGLLAWVGCHTDAYEQAKWFGDDALLKSDAHYGYDMGKVGPSAAFMLKHFGGPGRPLATRARIGVAFLGEGRKALIALASRLINLADVVEVYGRAGGVEAAIRVARERRATQFDPDLVDAFCKQAPVLLREIDAAPNWETVIAAEPDLASEVTEEELDAALEAIGEFAELKSPWVMGHATGVAHLSAAAARQAGLPEGDVVTLRRAGFVHDLGRLGVPNTIWDKRGSLTKPEMERVRLHPYITERMLAFSPALAPLGAIAGQHHERLDGSGYPRGLTGPAISPAGRILGAADSYHAMREARPYRPARTAEETAAELRREVASGRHDGESVDAVLRAAGHPVRRRSSRPAGLTQREVEVLRLVARGLSTREIGDQLVISPKTAANHVEHIYTKIGVSNRARAALFAMRHGLMSETAFLAES